MVYGEVKDLVAGLIWRLNLWHGQHELPTYTPSVPQTSSSEHPGHLHLLKDSHSPPHYLTGWGKHSYASPALGVFEAFQKLPGSGGYRGREREIYLTVLEQYHGN